MLDLTVDDIHTYYVLAGDQPVLVHNCPTGTGGGGSGGSGGGSAGSGGSSSSGGQRAAMERLLQQARDGGAGCARQELARLTRGGSLYDPSDTRAFQRHTEPAAEDDLFEPGSRSPYQPPRTKAPARKKATFKEKVKEGGMAFLRWIGLSV